MSAEVIRSAFLATEEAFLSIVTNAWPSKPQLASVGSCCLVGLIHERTLYVANLGDSRVVMGRLIRATGEIAAVQLSAEHNASMEAVRQELRSLHPDDSEIVVLKHDVWRVKGIIQEATICLDYVIGYGTNLIMTSTLGCVGLSQDTVSASVGFFGAAFYDFLAHLYTALHALGRFSFGNPVEYHRDVGSITVELLEQFYGFSVQDYK